MLGEQGVTTGNGFDDNFGLRKNSPAIDRANAYVATLTDIENRPRKRRPGHARTPAPAGICSSRATPASAFNSVGGTATNWRSTNSVLDRRRCPSRSPSTARPTTQV